MIIVGADVTSDTVDFYTMWIAYMLRKIKLIILVGVVCVVYIDMTV